MSAAAPGRWVVRFVGEGGSRRVVAIYPNGPMTWPLLPSMCPKVIEEMIAEGEVEGAKALTAGWLAALGEQHGVRGLELPPALQASAPGSAA